MRNAVIVTGASRGLGRAVALRFGREGWGVVVHYLASREKADDTVREIIKSGGDAFPFKADVRLYPEVEAIASEASSRWGRIDVVINNAGIILDAPIAKLKDGGFKDVMDVDLKGPFNMLRAVSEVMAKARSGHIINIASISGLRGNAGQAAYSASKAGLIGLTKAAASELAAMGILVNAVLPGYMLTDMGAGASDKARHEALRDNLLKRYSEPGEVADFIYHLVGMKAVSGQVFNLDSRII